MTNAQYELVAIDDVSAETPTQLLEDSITHLGASIAAGTYHWLVLIAEMDRRKAWGSWEMRSMAEWLSWRCGIAIGAGREHVRVARALESVPRLAAAFRTGEVTYSKMRALTRIIHAADDEMLLLWARSGNAAQIEKIVQGFRSAERSEEANKVKDDLDQRSCEVFRNPKGGWTVQIHLSDEEGPMVRQSLETAKDQATSAGGADNTGDTYLERRQRKADAFMVIIESFLCHGPSESGSDERAVMVTVDLKELANNDGEVCETADGHRLLPETARRLACGAAIIPMVVRDGEPLNIGRKSRFANRAQRRALRFRDKGCRFPGCTQKRFVDAHHIDFWSNDGPTDMNNLVELCRRHHRSVHERGYQCQMTADGVAFKDPSGKVFDDNPKPTATTRHKTMLHNVTPRTGDLRWASRDVNYADAVTVLFQQRDLRRQKQAA